jgi:hypothetical protein
VAGLISFAAHTEALEAAQARNDARYDALLERYHALKLQGAVARVEPQRAVQPPTDPTERVMAEAKRNYIDRVTSQYIEQGKSQHEAREIATMLADSLDDLSPVELS